MKKLINKIAVVFMLSVACFTGCTIEHEVYDKINPDIFPQNAKDADALMLGNVYHVFTGYYLFQTGWAWHVLSSMVTDEFEVTWAGTYIGFDMTPTNLHNVGVGGYPITSEDDRGVPYKYSQFLSKMLLTKERIKDVPMDDEYRAQLNAEIHCGMGFLAFLLYDLYGPVSLPTLEILQNPLADIVVPRATEEEMQKYIEDNLLAAAGPLGAAGPLPYKYDAANYGRFTKGLAQMVLLKYYMLTKQWAKAEERGRELTKSEYGYGLVPDYNSLFTEAGEKNVESIFSCTFEFGGPISMWPAHALPSNYPTPGQDLMKWNVYKLRWDFYDTFDPADTIRTKRIITKYTDTNGEFHDRVIDGKGNENTPLYLGALPVKYDYSTTVGMECPVDVVMYRYADAITLLAEAIVRNGGGYTGEPLTILNDVRARAGLAPALVAGEEDFLNQLLEERGHELWMEGHRRQDQIRHGVFIDRCVAKGTQAGLPTDRIEHMKQQSVAGKYDFERLPVPVSVINEGKGLIIQNPGY